MERNVIIDQLKNIFVSILEHENFEMNDELSAQDVDGWDSLSHIMIITKIEKHFGVRFKLKELNSMNKLGNLIELINFKLE